ncbi:MAG: S28 family serine protease [Bacteroidales bacterium]|nr:S28 family serine protease [Bacteroidales bacterium]
MSILHRFLLVFLFSICVLPLFSSDLQSKLEALPGVVYVEELKTTDFFNEKFLILFEQYLDPSVPEAGKFRQRVFLSHKSYDAPMVFITEGYSADYAESERYVNELSRIIDANQICVEHRYFSQSAPAEIDWSYLTTSLAAGDHHNILVNLKSIYPKKWVSTGISKGGQTCLLYQMYYPNDVDATVAYVAPVATALEDGRHEPFINSISTRKDQKKINNFQKEVLKRRATIFPMFEQYVQLSKLSFRVPIEEVYDYCVLEYSFAFWQWIGNTDKIPSKKEADSKIFQHLITVSGPDYFSIEGSASTKPFFYQAAKELGYYGYQTNHLEDLLKITTSKNYFQKIFLGKDLKVDFYSQTSIDLQSFLKTKANNTILIYGEFDPWTAAAPEVSENNGVIKIVKPSGTHATRIMSLPENDKDMVVQLLTSWMK